MFNSVRVTRLTTNLYTRHVHLVCCIDMSYSRYHTSYCFHDITTLREKVLKISLHFFMKTYFWSKKHQLTKKNQKTKNEKMHMTHFLEISCSKKSTLQFPCFPLSLYFHWYNNFNTWTKINVKLKTWQEYFFSLYVSTTDQVNFDWLITDVSNLWGWSVWNEFYVNVPLVFLKTTF